MKNNKVSLICTVYNEANTIEPLLESILRQTKLPEEIVFVDAGSRDNTVKKIKKFSNKHNLNTVIVVRDNLNRSKGRNLAIREASNHVIAVTDAGCVLGKQWLEKITQPIFDNEADSVAGYYLAVTPEPFQKAVAPFVSVLPEKFDPATYLPSSRSVAFTKRAWELAGKYPEKLNYCEDLIFAMHLKKNTKMYVQKKALVYWEQEKTYWKFFRQLSNYARGDVEANYQPHTLKIASVYIRYLIFAVYPPFFLIYLIWAVVKQWKLIDDKTCWVYLPSLQITADFAVMWGAFQGISAKKVLSIR